ncbi:smad nuclear interacting protein 1-like [Ptychodera flava]|uniref:smad nuclear interacting protein 1-like n=1 Tax=Ptychodera flava TaxID=63121 RepID=UPI003969F6F3
MKDKHRDRSRSRSPRHRKSHHRSHEGHRHESRGGDRHRHKDDERSRDRGHKGERRSREDRHHTEHSSGHRDRRDHKDRGHHSSRDRHKQRNDERDLSHVRIKQERDENDRRRRDDRRRRPANPFEGSEEFEYGQPGTSQDGAGGSQPAEKDKPNFELSGKLTEEANTFRGVVIKYNEPQEARKPKKKWRLYPFKGEQALPLLHIHRQSAYLFGRDRKIADIPIDHPSCSKQHAVLQFRLVEYEREDGSRRRQVRPYIIDLESSNGTFVNNKQIEHSRYVELMEKDMLKFGFSSREYVILHDKSKDDELDDDDEAASND